MRREKNYKTAKLIEALEYIDARFIEEAGAKIKERPTAGVYYATHNRKKTWRQIIALAACIALFIAAVPLATYLSTHMPDFIAAVFGDQTTETDPELTYPDTPPEETTVPAPETTVTETTVEETTAEPEDITSPEETTAEETTEEETTAEETTAPPEPEYDGSRGLEYKVNDDGKGASLVGIGTCTDKDIVVATKYNGSPVTEINSFALYDCQFLESIVIPEGVTVIGDEAFYLCKNLKKVTLPSTLEYIQDWAFANCESLESIVIPEGVKWIGQRAFSDCAKLSALTLGDGLEQIQENAFMNCTALKSVKFPRGLKLLAAASFDGCTKLASVSYGGTTNEWSRVGKEGAEWNSEWYRGIPATKVSCTDGDVYLNNLSESDAIEAARKFWNLSSDAVLFVKEKSSSYPYYYKIAECEPYPIYGPYGGFVVKREVFVDQNTGKCTEVVYNYPNIPEVFLDVIFNREKFLYVEQTQSSNGEYKYTTSEALFKDLSVHNNYVFGSQALWYYVTDIDGDSIPELIFPGSARSNYGMMFRVYEGKIYGYACILDGLHTDATYFWHEQAGNYRGRSQVYFDGIFYKSRRLTEYDINDPNNIIYYVEGKETTKEKYEEFESAFSNDELEAFKLDYYPIYVNPFPGG